MSTTTTATATTTTPAIADTTGLDATSHRMQLTTTIATTTTV